ncbi:MAG: replicative DNA helicase [Burkholderiales bacterium]|nr:replicative DNA helicase [Burkholderiales bacterium]
MTPSQSIEVEQSLLGCLLIRNDLIDATDGLTPEHFSAEHHRPIFRVLQAELLAGKSADVLTVFDALQRTGEDRVVGGLPYLNDLAQSVPSISSFRRYVDIVLEQHKARRLNAAGQRISELASDNALPLDDRIEMAAAELTRLVEEGAADDEPELLSSIMVQHIDTLERRGEGKFDVIPTGIHGIDSILGGGMRPGEFMILGARPSQGKTAMALTVALNVGAHSAAGFWSGEMPKSQLADRATSQLGRINLRDVLRPEGVDNEFWTRVCEASERSANIRLLIDDRPALTIAAIRRKARAMKRKHGIRLLVVDYLQLMSGTDPKATRNYQLEDITRGLKALAKELGIAVLALAQLGRDAEGRLPMLSDLRDSGAIEQDADIVLFLYRPIHTKPDLGEQWKHYAQGYIAKNRQGETGLVDLHFDGAHTRYSDWSGPAPSAPSGMAKRRTSDIEF